MSVTKSEVLRLQASEDIVRVRQAVRAWMVERGFSLVDQTKMVTAASELARNAVDHAGGGIVRMEALVDGGRSGIRLVFEDHGPGIPDMALAMQDGFSTAGGLGLGLGGAKRLVNEFAIHSQPGEGTRIAVTRWR